MEILSNKCLRSIVSFTSYPIIFKTMVLNWDDASTIYPCICCKLRQTNFGTLTAVYLLQNGFYFNRTLSALYGVSISSNYSEPVSFYCVFVLLFGIMSRKWWICMFELDGDKNRINDTIVYANVTCCHLEWKPAPPYTNMCCCLFDCAETDGLTFQNTQRKHNALLCVISPHFYFTRN